MKDGAADFWWYRAPAESEWIEARPLHQAGRSLRKAEPVLVMPGELNLPPQRSFRPLEEDTGLFRNFAELPPTQQAILEFSRRFGPLGTRTPAAPTDWPAEKLRDATADHCARFANARGVIFGDPLSEWIGQILMMRKAVELMDALRQRDEKALAKWIYWERLEKDSWRCMLRTSPEGDLAGDFQLQPFFAPLVPGDLYSGARNALGCAVREGLAGSKHPISPALTFGGQPGAWSLRLVPPSLREALWLQCALALANEPDFGRCEVCGRQFEISRWGSRSDRKTCGTACRSRAYRDRKAKAIAMHAEKKTAREIAKELGVDFKTAKGWISKGKT